MIRGVGERRSPGGGAGCAAGVHPAGYTTTRVGRVPCAGPRAGGRPAAATVPQRRTRLCPPRSPLRGGCARSAPRRKPHRHRDTRPAGPGGGWERMGAALAAGRGRRPGSRLAKIGAQGGRTRLHRLDELARWAGPPTPARPRRVDARRPSTFRRSPSVATRGFSSRGTAMSTRGVAGFFCERRRLSTATRARCWGALQGSELTLRTSRTRSRPPSRPAPKRERAGICPDLTAWPLLPKGGRGLLGCPRGTAGVTGGNHDGRQRTRACAGAGTTTRTFNGEFPGPDQGARPASRVRFEGLTAPAQRASSGARTRRVRDNRAPAAVNLDRQAGDFSFRSVRAEQPRRPRPW